MGLSPVGDGADYAFEVIRRPATIELRPGLLAPGGTGVLVGLPPEGRHRPASGRELSPSRHRVLAVVGTPAMLVARRAPRAALHARRG